jgi:hypothetical protein
LFQNYKRTAAAKMIDAVSMNAEMKLR